MEYKIPKMNYFLHLVLEMVPWKKEDAFCIAVLTYVGISQIVWTVDH